MPLNRSFIRKIIVKYPNKIYVSKRYDYFVKEFDDYFEIYRRAYEGRKWHKILTVDSFAINSKDKEGWKYEECANDVIGEKFVI